MRFRVTTSGHIVRSLADGHPIASAASKHCTEEGCDYEATLRESAGFSPQRVSRLLESMMRTHRLAKHGIIAYRFRD